MQLAAKCATLVCLAIAEHFVPACRPCDMFRRGRVTSSAASCNVQCPGSVPPTCCWPSRRAVSPAPTAQLRYNFSLLIVHGIIVAHAQQPITNRCLRAGVRQPLEYRCMSKPEKQSTSDDHISAASGGRGHLTSSSTAAAGTAVEHCLCSRRLRAAPGLQDR